MKIFLAVIITIVILASFFPIHAQTTIKVGVYDNKPKIYKDTDGVIKGFWADVVNAIAKKENWTIDYVYGSWDEDLAKLQNGSIDIMVDVAETPEREKLYDFNNETVLIAWGLLYSRKGITLNSFEDLQGKKIAVLGSGVLYEGEFGLKDIMQNFHIEADVIQVEEYTDVFKLLDGGFADIGVVNNYFGIGNEKNFNIVRSSIFFQPSKLMFAFPKGSTKNASLISAIDKDLVIFKNDSNSEYNMSIYRNFDGLVQTVEVIPKWLIVLSVVLTILGLSLLIAFIVLYRYQRKLQVKINELLAT